MKFRSLVVVVVTVALSAVATRADAKRGDSRARDEETAQVRELLAKLAAASAEAAPEEKTDADLMYEAMLRWNGQPAGSAAIDRLIQQSGKEADRTKRATQEKIRQMFWRDPFSDERRLVPVRHADRMLLAAYGSKPRRPAVSGGESEVSRLRAELAAARADAETARAEAARIRERADSSMSTDRAGCYTDDSSASEDVVAKRVRRHATRSHARHRSSSSSSSSSSSASSSRPVVVAAAPPPPPAPPQTPMPTSTKPAWTTGGPNGIIITPLESPPPVQTVKPERHARASARPARSR
jgi:hypothetical protein